MGSTLTRENSFQPHHPLHRPVTPSELTLSQLMASACHLGHSHTLSDPVYAQSGFVYGTRHGVSIIDSRRTLTALKRAAEVVRSVVENDGIVVFLAGQGLGLDKAVDVNAKRLGRNGYGTTKWQPGALPSFTLFSETHTVSMSRYNLERRLSLFQSAVAAQFTRHTFSLPISVLLPAFAPHPLDPALLDPCFEGSDSSQHPHHRYRRHQRRPAHRHLPYPSQRRRRQVLRTHCWRLGHGRQRWLAATSSQARESRGRAEEIVRSIDAILAFRESQRAQKIALFFRYDNFKEPLRVERLAKPFPVEMLRRRCGCCCAFFRLDRFLLLFARLGCR